MRQLFEACSDVPQLERLIREELPEGEEMDVLNHLDHCPKCQQKLEDLAGEKQLWEVLPEHLSSRLCCPDDLCKETAVRIASAGDAAIDQFLEYLGPTDYPDTLGSLGNYQVEGIVGRGGAGIVVKAYESNLNRYVAIKVLSPLLSHSGAARERFAQEGRAIAAVAHEHVVPVYAVDEFKGLPYIVMQYVSGASLQHRIDRQGPLNPSEVVRIAMQVASGLAAAHSQGIVHRDIKPANILLEHGLDRAMVTDFGLARVADSASLTTSGIVAGTPSFMAPEQAKGERIDERSDLFSLGCVMYAMCTGRPPFRADTVYGVLRRICEDQPRAIRELNAGIPEWLDCFTNRLLSKSCEDRFPSAEEVFEILKHELAHMQSPLSIGKPDRPWSKPQKATSAKRWGIAQGLTAVGLLLAVLGAGGSLFNAAPIKPDTPMPISKGKDSNAELVAPQAQVDIPLPIVAPAQIDGRKQAVADPLPVNIQAADNLERTYQVEAGGLLLIEDDDGNVKVIAGDNDKVKAKVRRWVTGASNEQSAKSLLETHKVDFEHEGNTVAIRGKHEQQGKLVDQVLGTLHVAHEITVPSYFNVKLKSSDGDLEVHGLTGSVDVTTSDGNLKVDRIEGPVTAQTSDGDVKASHIQGPLDVKSSDGELVLDSIRGDVTAQTSDGDVRLSAIKGGIDALTSDGSIAARFITQPLGDVMLHTKDGDIRVELNPEISAKIFVSTEGGELENRIGAEELQWTTHEDRQFQTTRGDGRINIFASTHEGNITFEDTSAVNDDENPTDQSAVDSAIGIPGELVSVKRTFSGGVVDGYTLYLPVSYSQSASRFPVLMYLQGGLGVGGDVAQVNGWGIPKLLQQSLDHDPELSKYLKNTFIVVSPHLTDGQYFEQEVAIHEVLDEVRKKYRTDSARTYLTGLSRGGSGTWGLASRMPNTFAAIAPIAGSQQGIDDFSALAKVPVWVVHNSGDNVFSYDQTASAVLRIEQISDESFHRIKTAVPTDLEFLKYSKVITSAEVANHDAWSEVYRNSSIYKWLLRQHK